MFFISFKCPFKVCSFALYLDSLNVLCKALWLALLLKCAIQIDLPCLISALRQWLLFRQEVCLFWSIKCILKSIPHFDPTSERHSLLECVNYYSVSVSCIKMVWKREINSVLPDKIWKTALSHIHSCSINSRQVNSVHSDSLFYYSLYYSTVMLNKFYPSLSPSCDKCKADDVLSLHLFWNYQLIHFVEDVFFLFFLGFTIGIYLQSERWFSLDAEGPLMLPWQLKWLYVRAWY